MRDAPHLAGVRLLYASSGLEDAEVDDEQDLPVLAELGVDRLVEAVRIEQLLQPLPRRSASLQGRWSTTTPAA